MIKPSRTILIGGAAAGATVIGSLLVGRGSGRRLGCVVGLAGVAAAAVAWLLADRQDQEITRNPDTMNGHFLTAGESSAMAGGSLADIEQLRTLVGSRALDAVGGGGRRKGGHRGDRLR